MARLTAFVALPYHAPAMAEPNERTPPNLTLILLVVGLVVSAVWAWKRLAPDTQDYVVDYAVPAIAVLVATSFLFWTLVRNVLRRRQRAIRREALMQRFEREANRDKRFELGLALIELNDYRLKGLERIAPALFEVFRHTLTTALDDKQHRIRGMAASHLGVLQEQKAVPLLMKALNDDHAYVRSSAALGLGRLRAQEAKAKLQELSTEDWEQTVRSRSREALERIA